MCYSKTNSNRAWVQQIMATSPIGLSVVICLGYLLVQLFFYHFILTDFILEAHYQYLGSESMISELIDNQKSRRWIYLTLHQFLIVTKIIMISLALFLVGFLLKKEFSFQSAIRFSMSAEVLVLFYEWLKSLWLVLIKKPQNLDEVLRFSPLSLTNLEFFETSPFWIWHFASYLNAFELSYLIFLSLLIYSHSNLSWKNSIKIVTLGYGASLLVWLSFTSPFLFYAEVVN